MKMILNFLISLSFVLGLAQEQEKILKKIQVVPSNKQAKLYNDLAYLNQDKNIELMYQYASKALIIAHTKNQLFEEAKANYYIGVYELSICNYSAAIHSFNNVKKIIGTDSDSNDEKILFAKATANLGLIQMEQNHYFQSLTNYKIAKTIFEKQKLKPIVIQIDNNIGVIYRSVGDYKLAIQHFKEAIKMQDTISDASLGYTYANLGRTYQEMKKYELANINYNEALKVFKKYPDERGLGELYNYISETSLVTENYLSTKTNIEIAEKYLTNIKYTFGLSETYYIKGKLFFEQKQLDKALIYANKMLTIGNELKSIDTQANAHHLLSKIYETKKETVLAFKHFKIYHQLKENLINIKVIRENFEIEKQHALNQQYAEHQVIKEKEFRNKLFWIFGLVLFTVGVASYFLIQNHKKAKQSAELQKELAEYEQKALHLQMNPHFVFNCLAAISAFIVQNSQHEAIKYLSKFSKLMRLTLDYSKASLISVDKEIEGLTNYMELERLRFQGIFDYTINKDNTIEDDCALPPMLLQPLVENAIIHGIVPNKDKQKGEIIVQFKQVKDKLIITIDDNGIGIIASRKNKAQSVTAHVSMALEIITKRLDKMHENKAVFEIIDLSDNDNNHTGTRITLRLPLQFL